MRHRDVVVVDRVRRFRGARREVRDDLVAIQVEVDPAVRAAPLAAAQHAAIESARRSEIVDWESEVEGRQRGHRRSILRAARL